MNALAQNTKENKIGPISSTSSLLIQRKCACGGVSKLAGQCSECEKKKLVGGNGPLIQPKLRIGQPNDKYEQEADRVADQVMAMSSNTNISGTPLRIQRLTRQATGGVDTPVPASVDRALACSGRPIEPVLQQDMGQRFGYDFSQVRVHSGVVAEGSARDVSALAYTVGHDIVFGANQFVPATREGRRLLAHELTHVVQQGNTYIQKANISTGSTSLQRQADKSNPPTTSRCDRVDAGPGGLGGTHIDYEQNGMLRPTQIELIEAEFTAWVARGRLDQITIDGFAGSEGPPGINWGLSCDRAEEIKTVFVSLGVPAGMVTTIAHGETEEFSTSAFPPNRRAVIRIVATSQPGPNPGCPATITGNTRLTTDCGNSITIGADNIILDCSGHTLTGSGGGSGILLNRRRGVRVVNCRVTNFRNGFGLRDSTANTFTNNTSFRNTADGFDLNSSASNVFIQNNATENPDHGFEFDLSGSNLIVGNTVSRNGDGFDASGINRPDSAPSPNNTFANNIADSNDETGFRISSDGNTLSGNTASNSTGATRRGDGFRIEGNNNNLTGNTGSGNQSDDLDVRNNTTGNRCTGNTFGNTNGQCPPDI